MEYILWGIGLVISYKVLTTVFKKKETEFYTSLSNDDFSSSSLSFSLTDWKGVITNVIDDGCFKNYYEVRRTAPMIWQWRRVDIADHSAHSESRRPVGIEYIIKRNAYEELLEIDEFHTRLNRANTTTQMVSFYRHDNESEPSIDVIRSAGLMSDFEDLVLKARDEVKVWKDMDHEVIVQLETFYIKNNVA